MILRDSRLLDFIKKKLGLNNDIYQDQNKIINSNQLLKDNENRINDNNDLLKKDYEKFPE